MTFEPIEQESDDDGSDAVVHFSFWSDLNRHLENRRFRRAYVEQSQRMAEMSAETSADNAGPFRDDLRSQLVTAGTAAAEQWLTVRANRSMSAVSCRRLAGYVVNTLWAEIERAALEMAQYVGDGQVTAATERAEQAEAEAERRRELNQDLARSTMRHMEKLTKERDQARESHQLSEAQLIDITLDRAEWRKQAQQHDAVAKILRAQLVLAESRRDTAEAKLAHFESVVDAFHAEADRMSDRYDDLRNDYDRTQARLAELRLLRLEWSTANCYSDLGDDIVSEQLARRRVASQPEIHTAVVSRQIYAGPWREGACRSCGTDERVVGDPPLCSSCAVYGGGWSSQRPDASLDGLRGPFTGLLGPLGIAPDVQGGDDA